MQLRDYGAIGKGGSRSGACLRGAVLLATAAALSACAGAPQAGPEAGVAPGYGYTCNAGFYMCRLPQQVPLGAQCSCPGLGATSYGTVR